MLRARERLVCGVVLKLLWWRPRPDQAVVWVERREYEPDWTVVVALGFRVVSQDQSTQPEVMASL